MSHGHHLLPGQILHHGDQDAAASHYLKKAAKLKSGSNTPGRSNAGSVTAKQIREIAEAKMKDLNANDIDGAMQIILGSARSMGIEVKG